MRERDEYHQGKNAHNLFSVKTNSSVAKKIYGDGKQIIIETIKKNLKKKDKIVILDLGSHKGELLEDIVEELNQFKFEKISVDINTKALEQNKIADKKIISNLTSVNLDEKISDITITRYVLHWNTLEDQEKIISEIKRLTKGFAIIQHVGPENEKEEEYRKHFSELFQGKIIPILKRKKSFWTSSKELEKIFKKLKIKFEKIEENKIDNVSENLKEKYKLSENDFLNTQNILGKQDYVIRTTWILRLN